MSNQVKLTGWKLLGGSHKFPGPDGGTCVNEASIIARGFEYKAIGSADDMPPCFSRVISQFALEINDALDDVDRNKYLTPFIARLPGTKDRKRVEYKRLLFILSEMYTENDFSMPRVPDNLADYDVEQFTDFLSELNLWDNAMPVPYFYKLFQKLSRMSRNDLKKYMVEAKLKEEETDNMADLLSLRIYAQTIRDDPKHAVRVLDEAIRMGRHETIANVELINKRMDEYKKLGSERGDVED